MGGGACLRKKGSEATVCRGPGARARGFVTVRSPHNAPGKATQLSQALQPSCQRRNQRVGRWDSPKPA